MHATGRNSLLSEWVTGVQVNDRSALFPVLPCIQRALRPIPGTVDVTGIRGCRRVVSCYASRYYSYHWDVYHVYSICSTSTLYRKHRSCRPAIRSEDPTFRRRCIVGGIFFSGGGYGRCPPAGYLSTLPLICGNAEFGRACCSRRCTMHYWLVLEVSRYSHTCLPS